MKAIKRLALIFLLYQKSTEINYETVLRYIAENIDYVIEMKNLKIDKVIKILGAGGEEVYTDQILI